MLPAGGLIQVIANNVSDASKNHVPDKAQNNNNLLPAVELIQVIANNVSYGKIGNVLSKYVLDEAHMAVGRHENFKEYKCTYVLRLYVCAVD